MHTCLAHALACKNSPLTQAYLFTSLQQAVLLFWRVVFLLLIKEGKSPSTPSRRVDFQAAPQRRTAISPPLLQEGFPQSGWVTVFDVEIQLCWHRYQYLLSEMVFLTRPSFAQQGNGNYRCVRGQILVPYREQFSDLGPMDTGSIDLTPCLRT